MASHASNFIRISAFHRGALFLAAHDVWFATLDFDFRLRAIRGDGRCHAQECHSGRASSAHVGTHWLLSDSAGYRSLADELRQHCSPPEIAVRRRPPGQRHTSVWSSGLRVDFISITGHAALLGWCDALLEHYYVLDSN